MRQRASSYPVQVICRVWEIPRSTYYYRSQAADDQELRAELQRLAGMWPRYGSRRLTAHLQREGFQVNRKHIQRLMRELGIQGHIYTKKRRTTHSEHGFPRYPNLVEQLEIVRPEQVWVCEITYIRLRVEFVYLAVLMDVADARH
jgi:putative transposase